MKPYLTEKTYTLSTLAKPVFTFLVDKSDTQESIRAKIKQVYNLNVVSLRFTKTPGHLINRRGVKGQAKGKRKALITLEKGKKIAAFDIETDKDKKDKKQDAK